jgi:hypothetical protein
LWNREWASGQRVGREVGRDYYTNDFKEIYISSFFTVYLTIICRIKNIIIMVGKWAGGLFIKYYKFSTL